LADLPSSPSFRSPLSTRQTMVARLLRSTDFQRVLAVPPRSRSTHFAVHHVAACPSLSAGQLRMQVKAELSTGDAPSCPPPVDGSVSEPSKLAAQPAPEGCWLGLVVPKRHAKRSVTRNLLKRQMRTVMAEQAANLPPGLWVLRLKAPFDRKVFTSPASDPLRAAAGDELLQLLQRAAARR
jgi:ribonuclease P protein component